MITEYLLDEFLNSVTIFSTNFWYLNLIFNLYMIVEWFQKYIQTVCENPVDYVLFDTIGTKTA
ncbi:hypothetical protein MASR2M39_25720 [Ignavibacteriales bacterium]